MSSLKSNITKGFLWQSISIASTFLLIPLCISYLGKEDYGLWVVLYSFLLLLQSCDLGIASSFRNALTKLLTQKKKVAARCLVSTTYVILASLSLGLFAFIYILQKTLGIEYLQAFSLSVVLAILFIVLLDFNLKLVLTVYTSNHKAFVLPMSTAISNVFFLLVVIAFYFTQFGGDKRLIIFCFIFPVCSLLTNLSITIYAYKNGLKFLRPNVYFFRKKYFQPIIISGASFFVIQVSMAILTQYASILVFEYSSSEVVADVSILDKFFGMITVIGSVLLFPYWSKFTQKYTENDFNWIKKCIFKLELFFVFTSFCVLILWYAFPFLLDIWMVGDNEMDSFLSGIVAIKYLMIFLNSIYSYYLNGIGKLRIQIILYTMGALFIVPLSSILFEMFGIQGVVGYSAIIYFILAIVQKTYIMLSLRGK